MTVHQEPPATDSGTAAAPPAQRPFLDDMPGEPRERQYQRQRAERDLPPCGATAGQPHDELLARPAIDVDAIGKIADVAGVVESRPVACRRIDRQVAAGQREECDELAELAG